jgi:carboxyl-terminal processing protease
VAANEENFFLRFRTVAQSPAVEFSVGSGAGLLRVPFGFETNKWYYLAGTYDGTTARVYVNGAEVGSEPLSGSLHIDSSPLFVGCGDPNYSNGEYFNGASDAIRIWSQARSPAEIRADASAKLQEKEPGLVADWDFEDGTARDTSGHGNDGRLQGGARIAASTLPAALEPVKRTEAKPRPSNLSTKGRLEILDELWTRLSDIYPALEYKGIYGRQWIEPTAEAIRHVKSDREFYDLLLELMASLKDTHTRIVFHPGQPRPDAPPVVLNQVEGKVAVIRAKESTGLKPGDVVLSVDGKRVGECLAAGMKRVCASTDRARIRGACWQLLEGPPGSTVTLTVEGADDTPRRVSLRRAGRGAFLSEPVIASRALGESLGYIRISGWGGRNLVGRFDRALQEFKDCKGLVIDVRGNGGGSDELADLVNGRFVDKPVVSSIDFWRQRGTETFDKTIGWVRPRGPWTYRGRVAVLIDAGCASACEHFVSGIEAMKRVLLVGTPTNGAGGGPTLVTLSDGTKVVISRALGLRANGVVFEGHGIPPDIFSSPTLDDLRHGRDAALEIAKAWLLSGKPVPPRTSAPR